MDAFSVLINDYKNIILFIQPRHPERRIKIISYVKEYNLSVNIKSKNKYPLKKNKVYLFDTFGESGNIVEVSDIIILGGTLMPIGGHNIIEPAKFGKCIISGKHNFKIKDIIKKFEKARAITVCKNSDLASILKSFIENKQHRDNYALKTLKVTETFKNEEDLIFSKLEKDITI